MNFAISTDNGVKIKGEKLEKIHWQRAENVVEHEGDGFTSCSWSSWNGTQSPKNEIVETGDQRQNRDHPNYRATKITKNTSKSPGDPRGLAVVQTPVKKKIRQN